MIKIYGFEHEIVIKFAKLMENFDGKILETIVKAHKKYPHIQEIEDSD